MADDKSAGGESLWSGIGWFLLIMGGLFVLWAISGGYQRASKDDKFVEQNEGLNAGETYDKPVTIFDTTF